MMKKNQQQEHMIWLLLSIGAPLLSLISKYDHSSSHVQLNLLLVLISFIYLICLLTKYMIKFILLDKWLWKRDWNNAKFNKRGILSLLKKVIIILLYIMCLIYKKYHLKHFAYDHYLLQKKQWICKRSIKI